MNISNFLPASYLASLGTKTAHLPKPHKPKLCNLIKTSKKSTQRVTYGQHSLLELLLCVPLRMLWAQHLELLAAGCPTNKSQKRVQLVPNKQKVTKWKMALHCSKNKECLVFPWSTERTDGKLGSRWRSRKIWALQHPSTTPPTYSYIWNSYHGEWPEKQQDRISTTKNIKKSHIRMGKRARDTVTSGPASTVWWCMSGRSITSAESTLRAAGSEPCLSPSPADPGGVWSSP